MRRANLFEPGGDLGRKRRRSARRKIDMDRQQFGRRRDGPLLRVNHATEVMQSLLVEAEQLRGDPEPLAEAQFALVVDMRLESEHRAIGRRHVVGANADEVIQPVGPVIEGEHVIGHIHVVVEVDPGGLNIAFVGRERRIDGHGAG